jgi:hypothetical protein
MAKFDYLADAGARRRWMLRALLAELRAWGAFPGVDDGRDRGIPFRPASWAGRALDSAERMACGRTARSLVRRGWATPVWEARRFRLVALRPTASGLVRALAANADVANVDRVRAALASVAWGRALLRDPAFAELLAHDRMEAAR